MRIAKRISKEFLFRYRKVTRPSSVSLHGVDIFVDFARWSPRLIELVLKGNYEVSEAKAIASFLSSGDRVLDIGGGIGLSGLLAGRVVGDQNVAVYEANPVNVDQIKRNFALNRVSTSVETAAVVPDAYQRSEVSFFLHDNFCRSSVFSDTPGGREITVPARRFADLVKTHNPTALLMDVEGAEADILSGADLSSISKICLELHPGIIGNGKTSTLLRQLLNQAFEMDFALCSGDVVCLRRGPSGAATTEVTAA